MACTNGNGIKRMSWEISKNKKFDVKSCYGLYKGICGGLPMASNMERKNLCKRELFFAWIVAHGKSLIVDNVRKNNIIFGDWCCKYKVVGESISHLFLHCDIARELWLLVIALLGFSWVMPKSVKEPFVGETVSRDIKVWMCGMQLLYA